MTRVLIGATFILGLLCTVATAAPLKLKPASPQPSSVKSGLNVTYGYSETKFKMLSRGKQIIAANPQRGKPLRGLDYREKEFGENNLTATQPWYFAAKIKGYYRFDAPGVYDIEMYTNDGIDARIGGQRVGHISGITSGCETTVVAQVEAPSAGWYDLDILYFQNAGTSCLMMKAGPTGQKRSWVPNSAFGR
ncbi:MAG: hypothetical protein ABJH07_02050 [Sedimentitalea sp.]|uniref:hypothetical protein n=1 Tax=Sedimentitalea sp. TaxID=2048915 RepID=UPI003264526F